MDEGRDTGCGQSWPPSSWVTRDHHKLPKPGFPCQCGSSWGEGVRAAGEDARVNGSCASAVRHRCHHRHCITAQDQRPRPLAQTQYNTPDFMQNSQAPMIVKTHHLEILSPCC